MKSWKTTVSGIAAIIAAIALAVAHEFDADPATVADWGAVMATIAAGIGLLYARDNNKSSEKVGAK